MMEYHGFDSLAEFHLEHSDDKIQALIAHLVAILEEGHDKDINDVSRNLSNILGEAESAAILKLICRKLDIDYLQLMENCQIVGHHHVTPRLLLHILCLPKYYVADKLQVDINLVSALLNELHNSLTQDSAIPWLKHLLALTVKERFRPELEKQNVLLGLDVASAPRDTAEYRRSWLRRLGLRFRPPGSSY